MKFGKLLSGRMVPEWSDRYIRYKMMKGQLKSISAARESYLHAFEKLKGTAILFYFYHDSYLFASCFLKTVPHNPSTLNFFFLLLVSAFGPKLVVLSPMLIRDELHALRLLVGLKG